MQERIETMNSETQNTDLNNLLKVEPVQAQERIEILDVIRGFALLGILMANMAWFSSPALYFEILGENMWTEIWDTTTSSFINFLIQGKFYSIFSFLFGLGFAIFFERAKERTAKPKLLFYRRLFILLLIGLAHVFFIWYGDVLITYALLGFLLPLFFNRKPETLIKWAVSLFSVFIIFLVLGMGLMELAKTMAEETFTDALQPFFVDLKNRIESSFRVYGQGAFSEIMAQRSSDYLFAINQIFAGIFVILPLFLFGLYTGKKRIFQNMGTNRTFIRKTWKWSLVIGFTMSVVKYIFKYMMGTDYFSFNTAIYTGAGIFGDTGLCLFFITSIILLYQNRKWIPKLKFLANMGRMPLSNYLFQSIVCTSIFYSYGLGLYGKIGPALGLVLTVVIFTVQIFISKYWFKYYRFGPVEWIWRCLTYGKFFGIKLPEVQVPELSIEQAMSDYNINK
jgi:uncharacterized protein